MVFAFIGPLIELILLAVFLMAIAWVVRCVIFLRRDIGIYRDVPNMRAPLLAVWIFTASLAVFLILLFL
jgi:hypothetical protein